MIAAGEFVFPPDAREKPASVGIRGRGGNGDGAAAPIKVAWHDPAMETEAEERRGSSPWRWHCRNRIVCVGRLRLTRPTAAENLPLTMLGIILGLLVRYLVARLFVASFSLEW